ncbi:MAG: hypothetical protein R2848_06735 [Thermomicrobiales bacterium]
MLLVLRVHQAREVARDGDHHADHMLGDVVGVNAAVVREKDPARLKRIERGMVDTSADPLHPAQIGRGVGFPCGDNAQVTTASTSPSGVGA